MRIDGLVTCVGKDYCSKLREAMPIWRETLDSITLVTEPGDPAEHTSARSIATDVFTRYGAQFNKGAALSYLYQIARPSEWVLVFDADVKPPRNWRDSLNFIEKGYLYGAKRVGQLPQDPIGYFQLFHAKDPRAGRSPLFDCRYTHAGCYDQNFLEMWPKQRRQILGIDLEHLGAKRTNWFGPRAEKLMMDKLKCTGIKSTRLHPERYEGTFSLSESDHNKLVSEIRNG